MTYIKKVKVFATDSPKGLEALVNNFLSREVNEDFHVINTQYQTAHYQNDNSGIGIVIPISTAFTCMIYYSELRKE